MFSLNITKLYDWTKYEVVGYKTKESAQQGAENIAENGFWEDNTFHSKYFIKRITVIDTDKEGDER